MKVDLCEILAHSYSLSSLDEIQIPEALNKFEVLFVNIDIKYKSRTFATEIKRLGLSHVPIL